MRFPTILLWAGTLGFLAVGLAFLLWPIPMGQLVDIPIATPTARADFAATYGGFEIGFGLFLSICARRTGAIRTGLVALGLALAGFALGRTHGIVFSGGSPRPIIYWVLALEAAGAILSFAALWHLNRSSPPAES